MVIGVLALQGDFEEHAIVLSRLGAEVREVRAAADLEGLTGLIIPGGESTTITRLLTAYGLLEPLRERIDDGLAVMGTCAGAIVLAQHAAGLDRPGIERMAIRVKRNAFGRQRDSFETDIDIAGIEGGPVHAVFIRAPVIEGVDPPARILASLPDGRVVAARQGNMIALAFHPELTADTRVHAYFLQVASASVAAAPAGLAHHV
ncbi:MAG: pyridoxal 5'-phosphate synthase glutaminase subunit PdxT [Dehalococcoidia bacterium]|nr:pyridoxal 5'-phosphate synthase glutaminase subunit PdxT [Dehalococcoidia bacterium]